MSNVLPFKPRAPKIERREIKVSRPTATRLCCVDGDLELHPDAKLVSTDLEPFVVPPAGPPSIFAEGGEVILDLGDCTTDRTLLRLTPEIARAWAKGLGEASKEAKQQGE